MNHSYFQIVPWISVPSTADTPLFCVANIYGNTLSQHNSELSSIEHNVIPYAHLVIMQRTVDVLGHTLLMTFTYTFIVVRMIRKYMYMHSGHGR